MKFAIPDRLRVVPGRVHLADDRFVAMVHGLAAAQRIAAVEEQPRLFVAQGVQARHEAAAVVQVRRMVEAKAHEAFPAFASATAKRAHSCKAFGEPRRRRSSAN